MRQKKKKKKERPALFAPVYVYAFEKEKKNKKRQLSSLYQPTSLLHHSFQQLSFFLCFSCSLGFPHSFLPIFFFFFSLSTFSLIVNSSSSFPSLPPRATSVCGTPQPSLHTPCILRAPAFQSSPRASARTCEAEKMSESEKVKNRRQASKAPRKKNNALYKSKGRSEY